LRAFAEVRARRECTLLIVGSGPLESNLRRLVDRDRVPDVVFAGFLNQTSVAKAYACADAFALVSREHETWGLVVNEAMNFGLPVVVSDAVGCGPDLVVEGRTGFVVGRDDSHALADVLEGLVADAGLRSRLGSEGLARIEAWNPERAAEGVVEAVAAAVGRERWLRAFAAG
jgi:glycosyltransferase involved in cell wall biosynthesis